MTLEAILAYAHFLAILTMVVFISSDAAIAFQRACPVAANQLLAVETLSWIGCEQLLAATGAILCLSLVAQSSAAREHAGATPALQPAASRASRLRRSSKRYALAGWAAAAA